MTSVKLLWKNPMVGVFRDYLRFIYINYERGDENNLEEFSKWVDGIHIDKRNKAIEDFANLAKAESQQYFDLSSEKEN